MHFFFTRFFKVLWLHLIFTLPSSMLFIWSACYQTRIHCASELRLTILDLFVYEYFSFFFFFLNFFHTRSKSHCSYDINLLLQNYKHWNLYYQYYVLQKYNYISLKSRLEIFQLRS